MHRQAPAAHARHHAKVAPTTPHPPQLATSDVGAMTRARLHVGLPVMPVVSSIHMQQMDWNVLPSPMLSDCKKVAC